MNPLETWLATATRGLSNDSAAQVTTEIREHYDLAREEFLASGASMDHAEYAAIAALGEAKSANREYRRVLLTASEAALLDVLRADAVPRQLCPRRISIGKRIANILLLEALLGAAFITWKEPTSAYFRLPLAILFLGQWLPITTPRQGGIYRWTKWTLLLLGTALAAWTGVNYSLFGGAFAVLAYSEYQRASIRRKLPVSQWPKKLYF